MATRTHDVPIHPDHGAIVVVMFVHGNFPHGARACLDSGAKLTQLPYEATVPLGLKGSTKRGLPVRVADGQRVRTWRTKAPITAQILTYIDGKPDSIGPSFPVEPCFVKPRRRLPGAVAVEPPHLLGHSDFLKVFRTHTADATLTLEWDE